MFKAECYTLCIFDACVFFFILSIYSEIGDSPSCSQYYCPVIFKRMSKSRNLTYFESPLFNTETPTSGMIQFFHIFYFSKCKHILLTHYLLSPHPVNYAEMLIHMRDECLKCVRNWYNFLIVSKSSIQLTMIN